MSFFKLSTRLISAVGLIFAVLALAGPSHASGPIRVVVWDERQPAQKQAYENFLGNHLADFLSGFKKEVNRSSL